MLETFCLRLAAGLAMGLLVLPARTVNPRFYRIQWLIALGLIAGGGMAATPGQPDRFWLGVGLAAGACLVAYGIWWLRDAPGGLGCLLAVPISLLVAITKVPSELPDHLTAAGMLGISMTAMLMGHWYLIAPTMSLEPLMRLLRVFFIALGLRVLFSLAVLSYYEGDRFTDTVTMLWLALRWGAGFVGPMVLGWMAWQSAKIRATQSATGILYVVVIFVFMGELTDQLLASK